MDCWDVSSARGLKQDRGSDSQGLTAMVKWALKQCNDDRGKILVVDGSSGAMETNVLATTYPDVFASRASGSEDPAACWAGSLISTPLSGSLGKKASTFMRKWADITKRWSN